MYVVSVYVVIVHLVSVYTLSIYAVSVYVLEPYRVSVRAGAIPCQCTSWSHTLSVYVLEPYLGQTEKPRSRQLIYMHFHNIGHQNEDVLMSHVTYKC